MKTRIIMISALLVLGIGVTLLPAGCRKGGGSHQITKGAKYHCPMHPAVVADKPGDCPICNMRLVPIEKNEAAQGRNGETAKQAKDSGKEKASNQEQKPQVTKTMYRSTMNPGEISAKSGKDSMGMEMEAFEMSLEDKPQVPGLASVAITPETRQRMGLTLGVVEKRGLSRTVRTSARIVADETRLFRVTTKIEGWVEKLFVAVTGQAVNKGDPLLTIYSPELVSAQQEYLTVVQAAGNLAADTTGDAASGAKALLAAARQRLQLWDISDEQIARLEQTGQVEKYLTLLAPAGGFVIEKGVLAGQKIMPGDVLMVVADLAVVWGDADLYQLDLPHVQMGMPMELTLPFWPGKTFEGKVSFIWPALDVATRTLRIRLEIPNLELLLKPEMYADAKLSYPLGEKVAVPEGAIMRTGEHTYAFRDTPDGKLTPVEVLLGARSEGYYEVLAGLSEGDRVVTSANFLVDSESSMRAALEALVQ
ncbi:MAG: efflux RND transporter periplasmic adaptor subunit [Lentisphaerae bacterium]|nr:efflux RND transporter periplasmic adaptor subunit [Lentisphaerota bacterium]